MDLQSLSMNDDSNMGTVVGVAVVAVAVLGSYFLDWEWSAFPSQPVPLAIGAIAAAVALYVSFQRFRG